MIFSLAKSCLDPSALVTERVTEAHNPSKLDVRHMVYPLYVEDLYLYFCPLAPFSCPRFNLLYSSQQSQWCQSALFLGSAFHDGPQDQRYMETIYTRLTNMQKTWGSVKENEDRNHAQKTGRE
jgi:hypothetical protein